MLAGRWGGGDITRNLQSVLLLNNPQCLECGGQLDDGDRTRYCAIGDTILMSGRNTRKYVNDVLCIKKKKCGSI